MRRCVASKPSWRTVHIDPITAIPNEPSHPNRSHAAKTKVKAEWIEEEAGCTRWTRAAQRADDKGRAESGRGTAQGDLLRLQLLRGVPIHGPS